MQYAFVHHGLTDETHPLSYVYSSDYFVPVRITRQKRRHHIGVSFDFNSTHGG